jgi:uncharacterized membrane protein
VPSAWRQRTIPGFHIFQVLLAAFAAPLFLGGLLSDLAYARTYQIQWLNFAAWLIAGAMVFTGLALAWSLVELVLGPARRGQPLIAAGLLAASFVIGLLDSFMHARDAWGAMPSGLVQSLVVTALACAAIVIMVQPITRRRVA